MLVVMKQGASPAQIEAVMSKIRSMGYEAVRIPGGRTAIGLLGSDRPPDADPLIGMAGVLRIVRVSQPFRLASREWSPDDTIVELETGARVGGRDVAVIAGPCAVESEEQIVETARAVRDAGAVMLRAGAFKPRTSPYSFQGLGERGLELLAVARRESGLPVVTEVPAPETVRLVAEHADVLQVGARNMQNAALLRAVGRAGRPVLLKRGPAATLQELLLAAEYILLEGESRVILCERGLRSFDTHARNLLDLTAIPSLKELTHLPVIADPSHGTGHRSKVAPMARAAVAAGADGVMLEVHPDPAAAASDGGQALTPAQLVDLVPQLRAIAAAIGRGLAREAPLGSGAGHVA
jgi:3-deoxy-7-phosphoheptulonate synthase